MNSNYKTCNAKNNHGDTALHILCRKKLNQLDNELMAFLIQENICSINVHNNDGDLPLHLACRSGHLLLPILELLVSTSNVNEVNEKENTPLHELCLHQRDQYYYRYGNLKPDEKLMCVIGKGAKFDAQNIYGEYPIHLACRFHSLVVVKQFEPCGLACRTNNGKTVLHEVVKTLQNMHQKLLLSC